VDPIIAQNLLKKARESDNNSSPVNKATDVATEMAKKQAKTYIWGMIISVLAAVLPWILLVFFILFIWYAGCTNLMGTIRGWALSKIMKGAGICVF